MKIHSMTRTYNLKCYNNHNIFTNLCLTKWDPRAPFCREAAKRRWDKKRGETRKRHRGSPTKAWTLLTTQQTLMTTFQIGPWTWSVVESSWRNFSSSTGWNHFRAHTPASALNWRPNTSHPGVQEGRPHWPSKRNACFLFIYHAIYHLTR